MKLRSLSIIVTLIFLAVLIVYVLNSLKIKEKITNERKMSKYTNIVDLCNSLSEPERTICNSRSVECNTSDVVATLVCMSIGFTENLKVAKSICMLLKDEDSQKFCFARVSARIDLKSGKEQCDLIKNEFLATNCRADILKETDMEAALKECDALFDIDSKNLCKACIATDEEERERYCILIKDTALREGCISKVKK